MRIFPRIACAHFGRNSSPKVVIPVASERKFRLASCQRPIASQVKPSPQHPCELTFTPPALIARRFAAN
jgi:hypothetical protein